MQDPNITETIASISNSQPVIYIEASTEVSMLHVHAPRWAGLRITHHIGQALLAMCATLDAQPDIIRVETPAIVRWGSSRSESLPRMVENVVVVERARAEKLIYIKGSEALSRAPVESTPLPLDVFLSQVANGRRVFGNLLTDEGLDAIVQHDTAVRHVPSVAA